jgi:hypothetical protein
LFGHWRWMTLQVYQQPKLTCFHQSVTKNSYGSISLTDQWRSIDLFNFKETAKARSYSAVYSSDVFSIQFNNDVNTNVTLRNFILWSASQVNFFILQKDLSLKIGTYLHITAADQGATSQKYLSIARIDESLRFCCAHGYLEKMVGLPLNHSQV